MCFRFLSSTPCRCSALWLVAIFRASNSYTNQDRTSEKKTISIFETCTNMAGLPCENPRSDIPCRVSMIFFLALVILFILGGVFYYQERRKEMTYDSDSCVVLTRDYRRDTCQGKGVAYSCFSATWDVRLSKNPSINATAESIRRYRSIKDALARANEYRVRPCEVLR